MVAAPRRDSACRARDRDGHRPPRSSPAWHGSGPGRRSPPARRRGSVRRRSPRLTHHQASAARQRHGVLEPGTACEHRPRCGVGQASGACRGRDAGTAGAVDHARNAVVERAPDGTIVASQPSAMPASACAHRRRRLQWVGGAVAAGTPAGGRARRAAGGGGVVGSIRPRSRDPARRRPNGCVGAAAAARWAHSHREQLRFVRIEVRQRACAGEVAHHQREGLGRSRLAARKRATAAGCVASTTSW